MSNDPSSPEHAIPNRTPDRQAGGSTGPKFPYGSIVTTQYEGQEVDAIVVAYDELFYYVRLFGEYHRLCPDLPLHKVEEELTAAIVRPDLSRRDDPTFPSLPEIWTRFAAQKLLGRTIKNVRYLSLEETMDMDWSHGGLVLVLDDGTEIVPMRDNEGNDAGALFGWKPAEGGGENIVFTLPAI